MEIAFDAAELEGMSEEELRRKYDQHSRGSAGVPGANGREDFSDLIAKEMHKKKQKMEMDREGRKEKEFKFLVLSGFYLVTLCFPCFFTLIPCIL